MPGVLCESVGPGMRPSERAVTVRDVRGHGEVILVENGFLTVRGDKTYLPVGVCFIDKERNVVLVEFPHEAITGGNRLWVRSADLIWPNGVKPGPLIFEQVDGTPEQGYTGQFATQGPVG